MNEAVRLKYIKTNPLDGTKPPKDTHKEPDVLTKEQVMHLLETVRGERFEAVYALGALVGLRIGEILALRWENIDLERGTLKVQRTLWHGQTTQPKTPSSRRTLTLPVRALDCLVRLRSTSDGHGIPIQDQQG
jgi:integrase